MSGSERPLLLDARHEGAVLPFASVFARGVETIQLQRRVSEAKIETLDLLRSGDSSVDDAAEVFDRFFSERGFRCPLPSQIKAAKAKGFPNISAVVDGLLVAEARTGLLMGAQDWFQCVGSLQYGTLTREEIFLGMRGKVSCSAGEIVIRDSHGIIASYFQGPDQRTKLTRHSTDVVFFVFSAPGISRERFEEGVAFIEATFEGVSTSVQTETLE